MIYTSIKNSCVLYLFWSYYSEEVLHFSCRGLLYCIQYFVKSPNESNQDQNQDQDQNQIKSNQDQIKSNQNDRSIDEDFYFILFSQQWSRFDSIRFLVRFLILWDVWG
jgi:hypothetical protein